MMLPRRPSVFLVAALLAFLAAAAPAAPEGDAEPGAAPPAATTADGEAPAVAPAPPQFLAWSAGRALGPPDAQLLGFQESAWAPIGVNTGLEWLELRFVGVARPAAVLVHATEEPAALVGLLLGDEAGITQRMVPVERATLDRPGIVRFALEPLPRALAQVTLLFDTRRSTALPNIDAVGIVVAPADDEVAAAEEVAWAQSVRASSSWAHAPARVVYTNPPFWQAEVDATLGEIAIVFDRDMDTGGGLAATFTGDAGAPPTAAGRGPWWRTPRQYVVPVALEPASFYRLGLNVERPGEFRSALGVAAYPAVLAFATEGADPTTRAWLEAPRVVAESPEAGATDVDPATTELRFTFSLPMKPAARWRVVGEADPLAAGSAPRWSDDARTWIVPVSLRPATEYRVAINAPDDLTFQSTAGVPVEGVVYRIVTAAGEEAPAPPPAGE